MKIALLINRENFDNCSDWKDAGFELVHLGNGIPDPDTVTATKAQVLIVDAVMKIGPEIIKNMPELKLIHSQGVAFNAIDLEEARRSDIFVCNNAGMNAKPVAEQAVLLMLALIKNFRHNEDMVYAGSQIEAKISYFKNGLTELSDLKVGLVGFGAIAEELTALLRPFGCDINYYRRSGDCRAEGAVFLPLNELYASSDIVSLHVPVTPETVNMINGNTLKLFKQGAILINTSRGELADHAAVAAALKSGKLGGFGSDTLSPEPVTADNPFLVLLTEEIRSRVALSPHIAGITTGSFKRAYEHMRRNIEAVAGGRRPDCVVNGL
ncbi:MAG: GyaR protein [Oscillospiraceae bacterium]|nr:GyaR protein [Oscillospiraceae bacterium]